MNEILDMRPYRSLDDLFYDENGDWKHSKVNKTALTSLCKIEAFSTIKEMKSGKVDNHRQLLAIITDEKNYDLLKKGRLGMTKSQVKKAQKNNELMVPIVETLIEKYEGLPDWTRHDKIANYVEITSGVDADLVFPPELMTRIEEKNMGSIHDVLPGDRGIGWLCASEVIQKKTKNGKVFHRIKAINSDYQSVWLRVWGQPNEAIMPYSIWVADVSHDESWGFSTSCYKMKKVDSFD